MATFDEVVAILMERIEAVPAFGRQLRFLLDGSIMHIDGTTTPPTVTKADGPADLTISVSVDDFFKLLHKEIKPMTAFTTGKIKLKGDVKAAMSLQQIF
jgi:putative sterol carrier protein